MQSGAAYNRHPKGMIYLFGNVLLLVLLTSSFDLATISSRYREKERVMRSFALPPIPETMTAAQETIVYASMRSQDRFLHFQGNPQLSTILVLSKNKHVFRQSFFLMGRQFSTLQLSVTISHKDEGLGEKENIGVYVFNWETEELVLAKNVKFYRLMEIQLTSGLHEIVVSYQWNNEPMDIILGDTFVQRQLEKSVTLSMDLVDSKELQGMATKQNEAAKELLGSLSLLMQEQHRIFLDSLEQWEQVRLNRNNHKLIQENMYSRFMWQLVLIVAVQLSQLLYFNRLLRHKILI